MSLNFDEIPFLKQTKEGCLLSIRLTPKASVAKLGGVYLDANDRAWLKVFVNAPPVDGEANKALIELLAKKLKIAKTSFSLVAGLADRNKTVLINGDEETIRKNICQMLL